jgi:hypothetical protein
LDAPATAQGADQLYVDRANPASARQAAAIWSADLARNPADFDAAWKLARADYWIGGHTTAGDARAVYEAGMRAARAAIAIHQDQPAGHFWLAANMGALAEAFGIGQGLKYRSQIKQELETVLRIDPAFQRGSADRALGRWYFKVPHLFGGSHREAETHLRASLTYDPQSTASHFFLAELYLADHRPADASTELERVIAAPSGGEWAPEDDEFKAKARALAATIRSR